MEHPFYPSEEDLGFEPKRDALSFTHPVRHGSHEGPERRGSCMSAAELDSKNRNPGRRRIQVACNRCRKRKIKCSGDTGDGQGCSNCRSSGNTNCHFLRVNSSVLQTKVSAWPYPAVNATASPSRLVAYASKQAGMINSPNVRVGSFSRPAGYDVGLIDQNVYGRGSFSVDNGINYEDDSAFNQPQGYMMANGLPDYSGMWNQKTWNQNFNVNKPGQNGIFPEQDDTTLTQSAYPYMLPTGTPSTEMPPVVPTMALPSDIQSQTDRTLPNPASRQVPSSMSVVPTTPEANPTLPFTQDFRIGNAWAPRAVPNPNTQTSITMSNGSFSAPMDRTKLSQATAPAQDMAFGYLPMTTSASDTPQIPTTAVPGLDGVDIGAGAGAETFRATPKPNPNPNPNPNPSPHPHPHPSPRSNPEPRLPRPFARTNNNARHLGLGSCPEFYGYSTSQKRKNQSSSSSSDGDETTLINGIPYTRVRHPEINGPLTFSLLGTDPVPPEYRVPAETGTGAGRAVEPLGGDGF